MLDDNERPEPQLPESTPETTPMPESSTSQPEPDPAPAFEPGPPSPWASDGSIAPEPPPLAPDDTGSMPPSPPRRRASGVLPWVLVGVLVLLLAGGGFASHRLYTHRQKMAESTRALLWMVKAHAGDDQSQQAIAQAITAVSDGDYDRAAELVAQIAPKAKTDRGPTLPAIGGKDTPAKPTQEEIEEALKQLPDEARAYFRENPDIFLAFVEQCNVARKLRDDGKNVDDLRSIRDAIIEAGAQNDDAKVKDLLGKMTQLCSLTDNKEEILAELQPSIDQFKAAVEESVRQGRDPSGAVELMHKSEQAAAAGDMEKAKQYLQQGITAAQRAPRGGGAPGMMAGGRTGSRPNIASRLRRPPDSGGRLPMGPDMQTPAGRDRQVSGPGDISQVLFQNLMALTSAEDADLGATYETIAEARLAAREKNGDQIRQILDGALARIAAIGKRRAEFSQAASAFIAEGGRQARASDGQRAMSPGAGPGMQSDAPPGRRHQSEAGTMPEWSGQRPGQQSGVGFMAEAARVQVVTGLLDIITRARSLTEEQFQGRTEAITREIEQLLAPRGPQGAGRPGADDQGPEIAGVRGYETEEQKAAAEVRIREQLRRSGEAYGQLKASGGDEALIAEVDKLLTDARAALYAEEYIEAEELVNEAMRKLGLEFEQPENTSRRGRTRQRPPTGQ